MRRKISSTHGVALIIALLTAGIAAMAVIIIATGYIRHVNDAKLMFDRTQVANAKKAAEVQYMQDGYPDGVTYYFDAEESEMKPWSEIRTINGYGRSDARHNRNGETGAKGVPNLGKNGGPQLLAITVENADDITMRWQGTRLTAYDYSIMTPSERSRLTADQRDQIRADQEKDDRN